MFPNDCTHENYVRNQSCRLACHRYYTLCIGPPGDSVKAKFYTLYETGRITLTENYYKEYNNVKFRINKVTDSNLTMT